MSLPEVNKLVGYLQSRIEAEIEAERLHDSLGRGIDIIDLRDAADFEKGHVPGARHMTLAGLDKDSAGFKRGREIVLYGADGDSMVALRGVFKLATRGFVARELRGGFVVWMRHGFPMEA